MGKPLSAEHKAKISAALKARNASKSKTAKSDSAPKRRPGALAASTIKGAPGTPYRPPTQKERFGEGGEISSTKRSIDKIKSARAARGEMGKLEARRDGTSNARFRRIEKAARRTDDTPTIEWARAGRADNKRAAAARRRAR